MPLTVAIPTFNRRERVRRLVAAVLPQLEPGDELLVSDDASDDGTAEAFMDLPSVTVQRQAVRLGMVGNWNACLTAARHAWVCLLHDDDELRPGGLAVIRRTCALAGGPALVAHRLAGVQEEDGSDGGNESGWAYGFREPGAFACLRAEFCPSGVTVHRDIVAQIGGFDPAFRYSADMEYFARVCARFPSYVIEHPTVLRYVQHGNNYQLKTWRQPDFFEQLARVEAAAVAHARLPEPRAEQIWRDRMLRDLFHLLHTGQRAGDRAVVRAAARWLHGRPELQGDFGWSGWAVLALARSFGWYPARLLR